MTDPMRKLRVRAEGVMLADRGRLLRRLDGMAKISDPGRLRRAAQRIEADLASAEHRFGRRQAAVPARIDYPQELPITDHRGQLLDTIRDHQVVVVAGETGSGKSTQLPKLCLELGRGVGGFIGHTQPRRIAARSIAARVAEELDSPVGGLVGYTVRFADQVGDSTLIKLMTDGILLNEIHHDRRLLRYDTIILDEAHERSLNIDFLLGYLKRLLPRRRDLKLIITSATIDTARFAEHFDGAPVVEVSGRSYPVEIRYRPLDDGEAGEPRDQPDAICDAVVELGGEGDGDILVFCSGEREIRDAVDAIAELDLRHTEVVPLFGRLSAAEQHRIFEPHSGRRIVISTNVAETSLTVPGIRYVVDAGTARISRYSRRTKVQRLPIEPISQASANQRAGRCGRLGPGICIRLYAEHDFADRPQFTEPEIQRTNLASVVLQMAALELGDVASFPFLDPPDARAVRDGVDLLHELGAIAPDREGQRGWLTELGRQLARMPLDPRLGRMLIEAAHNGCLREMLIIAAALSIQDPRERPAEKEAHADQLHARFRHPDSDFLSWLQLWGFISAKKTKSSSSAFRRMCRDEYLNYKRLREWQDLHRQLRDVCREVGFTVNRKPATPDVIHLSLLTGLLSQVGKKDPEGFEYRGARGSRFFISPGSTLFKRAPEWVMAAELVETSRLWAHQVAPVSVEWIERLAEHLLRRTVSDPWWDAGRGAAVARQSVTLYGLPLVADRTVQYAGIDPEEARRLFIRHALVAGEWETHHEFAARNDARFEEVLAIERRERRSDLLVDEDALVAFFDARIPAEVTTVRHFDRWWRDAREQDPHLLDLTVEHLIDPAVPSPDPAAYPEVWQFGDLALPIDYELDPASEADGPTVEIPVASLDRVTPATFEWNVPGLRRELVEGLIRSLPKQHRRRFIPVAETVENVLARLDPGAGSIVEAVRQELSVLGGVPIPPGAIRPESLPAHLRPRFRIVDAAGGVLAEGPDLPALKRSLADATRATVAAAGHEIERSGVTRWEFGELSRVVELGEGEHRVRAYPALVDEGDSVGVRLLATPQEQGEAMLAGTVRLVLLTLPAPESLLRPWLDNDTRLLVTAGPYATTGEWVDDVLASGAAAVVTAAGGPAWDERGFAALRDRVRDRLADEVDGVAGASLQILGSLRAAVRAMERLVGERYDAAVADVEDQIDRLVYPGFLTALGAHRLEDVARYLAAIERRVERLPADVAGDAAKMAEVHQLEEEFARIADLLPPTPELWEVAWMLQELRVSLFAQALGTSGKVSPTRVRRALQAVSVGQGASR